MSDNYRIVICYRRSDSWGWAGRIYDHLVAKFSSASVFMDLEAIKPGAEFVAFIVDAVSRCNVLLVVIGTRWTSEIGSDGKRRLDDEDDVVRLEITTGLSSGVAIIPVLVEGASMPLAEILPDPIARLAELNAFDIHPKKFPQDIATLADTLQKVIDEADKQRKTASERIAELERDREQIDAELESLKAVVRADVLNAEREFQVEVSAGRSLVDRTGVTQRPYDAFLLYSHAGDSAVASALQRGLERFAKPWFQRRAMRVFRDEANLSATPDLWNAITTALERSKYLILLASPRAAESMWVHRELSFWLENRSPEQILIVLTDGEVVWDTDVGDFDWNTTTALPKTLQGVFANEPLFLDLRWARAPEKLNLRNPDFVNAVVSLAAPIQAVSKDELLGHDIREHRRRRRIIGASVIVFASMLATIVYMALRLAQML